MEPLAFAPLYMQRVWGGRTLESSYHRSLPDEAPYGESWEISDREHEQSLVIDGPYAGRSLHDLWTNERNTLFGAGLPKCERFPLLIKVLDARDDLSIQVHPPADIAPSLGGDPKTEMWYIADADPGAKLYVGLKKGTTRESFEAALEDGSVAEVVHAIKPAVGESIFIPSGRLHAIGAGFLIHEIQQNSDTTYRVFDWNRVGLDGQPRELHIEQSLKSIDFDDFEPGMDKPRGTVVAACELFEVEKLILAPGDQVGNKSIDRFSIFSVVEGSLTSPKGKEFRKGDFFILPSGATRLTSTGHTTILRTTVP
ncbi:type I phosphomannose isomerase catalytic subunit [Haloferula sp.]|uniref:type I phosphomannose isomerase catalytic subunit n=1 Tax=Haloferula sp. TaxID=2497595 RepID=UPI003C778C6D